MSQTAWRPSARAAPAPSGRPTVGVVLAAGRSERLHPITGGRSKALTLLGGLALADRAVRMLFGSGLDRVLVVVGYEGDAVAAAARRADPRVEIVTAERWELGNGESLASAEGVLGGEQLFVVTCGDHMFAPGALDRLNSSEAPAVLIDQTPDRVAWEEGTRVRVAGGAAEAFGKSLDEPAIDCGAFVLSSDVFGSQRLAAAEGDHSLAGAVTRLAQVRRMAAEPIPEGAWWQDVDTPADLRAARRRLRRSLAKDSDGAVSHYLNRPISTRLSMALSPLRIPPNALSCATFLVGMLGAYFLARGRALPGGLLIQASSVLDGMDGETARLLWRHSAAGALLDSALDRVVDGAVVAGLGLWLLGTPPRPAILPILTMCGVGWTLVAMGAHEPFTGLKLSKHDERRVGFVLGGRDGRTLLTAVGAALGHPVLALVLPGLSWAVSVALRVALRPQGVSTA